MTDSPQHRQQWLGEQVLNNRLTHDVEAITGREATSCRDFVARNAELFRPNSSLTKVSGTT
jgi:hypothetical protein